MSGEGPTGTTAIRIALAYPFLYCITISIISLTDSSHLPMENASSS